MWSEFLSLHDNLKMQMFSSQNQTLKKEIWCKKTQQMSARCKQGAGSSLSAGHSRIGSVLSTACEHPPFIMFQLLEASHLTSQEAGGRQQVPAPPPGTGNVAFSQNDLELPPLCSQCLFICPRGEEWNMDQQLLITGQIQDFSTFHSFSRE